MSDSSIRFDLGSRILSKLQFYYYRRAHYNVILKAIEVGHDVLQLPTDVLDSQSGKAVVIDSGTTLAYLADDMFTPLMEKPTLRNINLEVRAGEKVALCGDVGSGKSILLAAILGEVPNIQGTIGGNFVVDDQFGSICSILQIHVYGTIAYVSQSAWIQSGTIRENIFLGSGLDNERYQETLEKCSLVKDLDLLPYGDLTEIGERVVNLSGGQKQRIQLARALYQDADIYLLDDPFGVVNAHTCSSLFNEYVMAALSTKTVLLVTRQVDFLPAFDSVLLMSDGEILQAAPYHQLLASSREFQDLVNAHKETAGAERLEDVSSSQKRETSTKEIKKTHTGEKSKGDQLIKQEEREV
ncbi:ABC transporter C family member 10-like [Camellia sinensis]|uniref:ABC transporter C family member 10-like n=1 Tax=Camellia sinensis TaxID=4442 RepID=UPI001035B4D5|nr:ABC transporter C family member 10-like [Camellia sinensis]